jgi:hypothetical protein
MRGALAAFKSSQTLSTRPGDGTFLIDCESEASMLCVRLCSGQLQTVKRPYAASHVCDCGSCLRLFCVSSSVGTDTLDERLAATCDPSSVHARNIANVRLLESSSSSPLDTSLL